jgi:hypothetical protein
VGLLAATVTIWVAFPSSAFAGELRAATGERDPGGPQLETAVNGGRTYFDEKEVQKLYYRVSHNKPVTTRIKLIRESDESVVKTWEREVESDTVEKASFDGTLNGELEEDGRYRFRMTATDSEGLRTASSSDDDRDRDDFKFYRHIFPVNGKHQYWDGWGAGRNHKGQDIGADCGTELRAARGGKVQTKQYHSAAGYYLVIDAKRTGIDMVYMHLLKPSGKDVGDRVRTGSQIGKVGETGNASGCHLHFELWSPPGWYEGGSAYPPTEDLKYWDSYS